MQTIAELVPDAIVTDGVRTSASNAEEAFIRWLNAIGLAEQEYKRRVHCIVV